MTPCNCKDGVASGWVKCDGTGAEEMLDWPCHCPKGKAIVARFESAGRPVPIDLGWEALP